MNQYWIYGGSSDSSSEHRQDSIRSIKKIEWRSAFKFKYREITIDKISRRNFIVIFLNQIMLILLLVQHLDRWSDRQSTFYHLDFIRSKKKMFSDSLCWNNFIILFNLSYTPHLNKWSYSSTSITIQISFIKHIRPAVIYMMAVLQNPTSMCIHLKPKGERSSSKTPTQNKAQLTFRNSMNSI